MPWQQEAMKDAGACEKLRGAGKHATNRRYPNGETRHGTSRDTSQGEPTRGTETSQYPEERKSNETPSVAASESGRAQTNPGYWIGVVGPLFRTAETSRTTWEGWGYRVIPPYAKVEAAEKES